MSAAERARFRRPDRASSARARPRCCATSFSARCGRHGRDRQRGRRDRARRRAAARERRRRADGDAVERLRLLPDRQRPRLHDRPPDHGRRARTAPSPLRRIILETIGPVDAGAGAAATRGLRPSAGHRLRVAVVATFDAARGAGARRSSRRPRRNGRPRTASSSPRPTWWHAARLAARRRGCAGLNPLAEIVAGADRARDRTRRLRAPDVGLVRCASRPRPAPPHPRVTRRPCAAGRRSRL